MPTVNDGLAAAFVSSVVYRVLGCLVGDIQPILVGTVSDLPSIGSRATPQSFVVK